MLSFGELQELGSQLRGHLGVVMGGRVFDEVAEEAQRVKELVFSQVFRVLQLIGKEALTRFPNDFFCAFFEDFTELA